MTETDSRKKPSGEKISSLGLRNWFLVLILGVAGQIAWAVENTWFNTFVFDTITPDPQPIAWMVGASALTATMTTYVMGAYSDRSKSKWGLGSRRTLLWIRL